MSEDTTSDFSLSRRASVPFPSGPEELDGN